MERSFKNIKFNVFKIVISAVLLAAFNAAFCICAIALSVDYDGDGIPDAVGSIGNVPMPPRPTPVSQPKNTKTTKEQKTYQQKSKPAAKPNAPSSEQVAQQMMMQGMFQVLLNEVFAPPPGPTPEELQRIEAEKLRIEEEKKQQFLRSNAQFTTQLKGVDGQTTEDNDQAGGLKLKLPSTAAHRDFFGTPAEAGKVELLRAANPAEEEFSRIREHQSRLDELRSKQKLSEADQAELENLTDQRNALWKKAVSSPDLTQEERERLRLKMHVSTGFSSDHPMVDADALIAREQWSDPFLDVAAAAAKGGAKSLGVSLTEEGGKIVLGKAMKKTKGFDELLTAGKLAGDSTTAEKVVTVIDYGLARTPSWGMVANGAVNFVGAGTRQAVIRYKASKNKYSMRPIEEAADEYDSWVMDQNQWTRAALERVSAGRE